MYDQQPREHRIVVWWMMNFPCYLEPIVTDQHRKTEQEEPNITSDRYVALVVMVRLIFETVEQR
jgi:hypothetical protein